VARKIYETKAGEMPSDEIAFEGPTGPEWDEDDEEGFKKRWPKLFGKYWTN
jgi:hypothetical protein